MRPCKRYGHVSSISASNAAQRSESISVAACAKSATSLNTTPAMLKRSGVTSTSGISRSAAKTGRDNSESNAIMQTSASRFFGVMATGAFGAVRRVSFACITRTATDAGSHRQTTRLITLKRFAVHVTCGSISATLLPQRRHAAITGRQSSSFTLAARVVEAIRFTGGKDFARLALQERSEAGF